MKAIAVTKPSECPFNESECFSCVINEHSPCDPFESFPPDCPLFENDYVIKRRSEDGVATNPET